LVIYSIGKFEGRKLDGKIITINSASVSLGLTYFLFLSANLTQLYRLVKGY